MTKTIIRGSLPFLTGLLILAATGILVHLYRSTWAPGSQTEPRVPRAQSTFSLRLPAPPAQQGQPANEWPLVLRVVKESSDPLSVAYWPAGRVVLHMPVVVPAASPGAPPSSIRLALWDPGHYTLTLSDPATGRTIEKLPLHVMAPLSLFRNDLLLFLALGIAGYLSGRSVRGIRILFPASGRKKTGKALRFALPVSGRKAFSAAILLAGILLVAFAPRSGSSSVVNPAESPGKETAEAEGRRDAGRMLLYNPATLPPGSPSGKGYLLLSHRMDSWTSYGHDLTLFSGPVDSHDLSQAFLLPPDDGRYRMHLWETDTTGHLASIRMVSRATPLSPAFPVWVFSGLAMISLAFFILGATTPAVRSPATPLERSH